jgi:hypothetical protein
MMPIKKEYFFQNLKEGNKTSKSKATLSNKGNFFICSKLRSNVSIYDFMKTNESTATD